MLEMGPEALRQFLISKFSDLLTDKHSPRYFASYEFTKKFLTPAGSTSADLNLGVVILAGGTAGVSMWAIAIPPDVGTINNRAFPRDLTR